MFQPGVKPAAVTEKHFPTGSFTFLNIRFFKHHKIIFLARRNVRYPEKFRLAYARNHTPASVSRWAAASQGSGRIITVIIVITMLSHYFIVIATCTIIIPIIVIVITIIPLMPGEPGCCLVAFTADVMRNSWSSQAAQVLSGLRSLSTLSS